MVRHRAPDLLEVESKVVGDHEQLVGGGELDVTPGVGEELRQLCFLREQLHDLRRQPAEQRRSALRRTCGATRDDLRKPTQLLERMPLCDALGTEADVDVTPSIGEHALHQLRHTRIHRAPQHEQLTVHQVLHDGLDRARHRADVGAEVAIDRRADHNNRILGGAHGRGIRGGTQAVAFEELRQQRVGAFFAKRHHSGVDALHHIRTGVEQHNIGAVVCKGHAERESDMSASAHDHDVVFEGHRRIVS